MTENTKVKIFSYVRYEVKTDSGWQSNGTSKGLPVAEQATSWLNQNGLIPLNSALDTKWVTEQDGKTRVSVINLVVAAMPQSLYFELLSNTLLTLAKEAKPSSVAELPGILISPENKND